MVSFGSTLVLLAGLVGLTTAQANPQSTKLPSRVLESTSLVTCQENSGFQASKFHVIFNPESGKINVDLIATSSIEGNAVFDVQVSAYGYPIQTLIVNPCDVGFRGLCPMVSGRFGDNPFSVDVPKDALGKIPGIAYTFPDLDAKVRILVNMTSGDRNGQTVACLDARISNGKTVDLIGVKWASAVVAFLALISSAVISGLGYTNAASHVAANAVSLFGYFQAQAMAGLCGMPLPPIVQAWTQDFQWSMGLVKLTFMQDIFTWYQRSTGGEASRLLDTLRSVSVAVQKKRSLVEEPAAKVMTRAAAMMPRVAQNAARSITKRANVATASGSYVVYGIQRAGFQAKIESTNIFMTALIMFCVIMAFTIIAVVAWKGLCEVLFKKSNKFNDFRNGWKVVLKGILFRITLLGYPLIATFCLWELTQNDSPAEMVLAVAFFLLITASLVWATWTVMRIARRSVALFKNPAYTLFSDLTTLNKWGFLYIQYRASAYYFTFPAMLYTFVKACFIAFGQKSGVAQAVGLLLIEAGALIANSVLRPWMDKTTNSFNIAISFFNFLNAIFLLIFTSVFDQPPLMTGIIGILFWIFNAAFTLVLLLMIIITTGLLLFKNNPDARYQFMADDRTSFMKSGTNLNTYNELDALAASARAGGGEKPQAGSGLDLDDESYEATQSDRLRHSAHSPSDGGRPSTDARAHQQNGLLHEELGVSPDRGAHNASPAGPGVPKTSSPWQRGAGYEH
ncbi:calcium spray protein [Apiospora rasikravindrae]|uniref:Calcium spray protein n=1 Tax=Apiospora rasikravindrae TaxID=990691 RepID=A0ABR1SLX7_9PEZI